ncbi:MAG: peptidylprolyl isomerase [Pleurocapsa minor GSE-CHR-MK-17-07R]|jgi:parvulin-like peptidyl-prolyl isomerase|nr:peptidylprolyl isomerase [Pleurocapsa minor GSE-CHR-MK 17-07R]
MQSYRSKAEREALVQRRLLLGLGILGAVVAVLVIGALIVDQVITPSQNAVIVNGDAITVGEFQDEVRLTRALRNYEINNAVAQYQSFGIGNDQIIEFLQSQPPFSTWINESQVPDQLGNTVLNQIIDDTLVRQQAEALGITVTDEDIDAQIEDFFGYDPIAASGTATPTSEPSITPTPIVSPTASPTLPPTATPEATAEATIDATPTISVTAAPTNTAVPTLNPTEIAEQYVEVRDDVLGSIRSLAGIDDTLLRRHFETLALREALTESLSAEMGTTAPFVNARLIVVATSDEANTIIASLEAGESFAELARANSTDESAANGGELDWVTLENIESTYGADLSAAVAEAAIGDTIGPVTTTTSTYAIMQVRGREERDMDEQAQDAQKSDTFEAFLDSTREAAAIERFNTWIDYIPSSPALVVQGLG